MDKIIIIATLVLTVVIWLGYHKNVTVCYSNMLVGIFRELLVCFFVAGIIIGLIYTGISNVIPSAFGSKASTHRSSVSASGSGSTITNEPGYMFQWDDSSGDISRGYQSDSLPQTNIPATFQDVGYTDFVGEFDLVGSEQGGIDIRWEDFHLYIACYGTDDYLILSGSVPAESELIGNSFIFEGNPLYANGPCPVKLTYIPASDSPYLADTVYMETTGSRNMIYTRAPSSSYFDPYASSDPGDGDYLFPTDSRYITSDDLRQFTREEVVLIRNEIYARYGYTFHTDYIRDYFMSRNWYWPDPNVNSSTFNTSDLTEIERKNLETITKYERDMGWRS
mgnify:CR=1 FL=1|jgi:hypothetical protein